MTRLRSAWLLLPTLIGLVSAGAPSTPGLEVLRRAASNYKAAQTFWIEGDIDADVRSGSNTQSTTATFVVALGDGNRLHDELAHPQVGTTRISDGKQTWIYSSSTNQYAHRAAAEAIDLSKPVTGGGMLPVLLVNLRGLADDVVSTRVLPDETVRFGGKDRRCAVVEVQYKPPVGAPQDATGATRTYWLDRERDVVLKHRTVSLGKGRDGAAVEQTETFTYSRIALNGPMEPSLFTFVPPAGAKQVEQFGNARPPAEDLSGQTAGDFTLADLEGKMHRLRDLRGKVVMLDFWATWCGPCRRQMPLVEKLGHEMKDKGLVVFAVNQGESSETARRFLEKNKYGTTTLLDQKAEVGRAYKVSGIPTLVIIDRDGKIAAHFVGVRDEIALREGLKKAGL
jgi:thiol-disulfide isomerase/thioredoxin